MSDITIDIAPTRIDPATEVLTYCDLLETASYAIQDYVPLEDVRAWISGIRARVEILAANQDNLIAYARELGEEWVPDEWRGKEGWRIRRVQEKHGVRHLFED